MMRSHYIGFCILFGIAVAAPGQARAESPLLPPEPEQVDLLLVIDKATLTSADLQRVTDALPTFVSRVSEICWPTNR
jgi:hypothetical protein